MPITLKRKAPEADVPPRPSSAIPSTLPPSVEEAYRRKCIQLKNRTNEVENANDAARLRLARIKRQVEKLRIERAFLLEQLSKRTSTNVEDSDGSPSPPPTNLDGLAELMINPRKPKDKPLRTKRGHRKSMAADSESKTNASGPNAAQSPSRANGVSKSSKKPADAFEMFCDENRDDVEAKKKDGDADLNVEDELTNMWKELPDSEKEAFQTKFEKAVAKDAEDEKKVSSPKKSDKEVKEDKKDEEDKEDNADKSQDSEKPQTQDEDVEMTNYDTEDQETQDKADD